MSHLIHQWNVSFTICLSMPFLKIIMIPMPYLFAKMLWKFWFGVVLVCIRFTVTQSLGADMLGMEKSRFIKPMTFCDAQGQSVLLRHIFNCFCDFDAMLSMLFQSFKIISIKHFYYANLCSRRYVWRPILWKEPFRTVTNTFCQKPYKEL